MTKTLHPVTGKAFALHLDAQAHLSKICFDGSEFEPPIMYTQYEIDGQACDVRHLAEEEILSFKLTAGDAAGTLSVASDKGEILLHLEPDQKEDIERVGLNLFLPTDAVFHLAEHRNTGRMLDHDMPVGEWYRGRLCYNFLLIDIGKVWIRFRSDHPAFNMTEVDVVRHPDTFGVTVTWPVGAEACIAAFSSMQEAVADFQARVERDFSIHKLRAPQRGVPDWVHNVQLVITADMLRSSWEVSHDYEDVLNLARDLGAAGCPEDTLFYIPGWQGAYDSTHPTYWPHPELGGERAFRAMVDGLHECGFRLMIHVTGWGIDPYHPDIDRLEKLVLRYEDGAYRAWQTDNRWFPGKRPLKLRTDRIPLKTKADASSRCFNFDTPTLPDKCEALVTVGGVNVGAARIRLTCGRRSVISPPSWFADHDAYDYPFPLMLAPGKNRVQVEVVGESVPDWSKGWYRIRHTFGPPSPYSTWTWPILLADTQDPEYIDIFTQSVASVVHEFNIDAVHVDATWFNLPKLSPPSRDLILRLRERLPGVALGSEAVMAFEEMGVWAFSQGAAQSLFDAKRRPIEQSSLSLETGLEVLYGWMNKTSPVCAFGKDYFYNYPHLCAANGFVPTGKVCNIFPARKTPRTSDELWKVLRDARRLDHIPGLRVNYRDYGLDEEARSAIIELTR